MSEEDEGNNEREKNATHQDLTYLNLFGVPTPIPHAKKVITACSNCKNSHLACDEGRPCSRCVSRHCADTCRNADHKKRGRRKNTEVEIAKRSRAENEKKSNEIRILDKETVIPSFPQYVPIGVPLYPLPFQTNANQSLLLDAKDTLDIKGAEALVEHQSKMLKERRKEGGKNGFFPSNFGNQSLVPQKSPVKKFDNENLINNEHNNDVNRQNSYISFSGVKSAWEGFPDQYSTVSSKDLLEDFTIDPSLFNMSPSETMRWLFTGIPQSVPYTKQETELGNRAMSRYKDPPWNEQINLRMMRHFASGGLSHEDLIGYGKLVADIYNTRKEFYYSLNVGQRMMMETEFHTILQDLKKHADENPTPTCIWDIFGIIHHMNASLRELCGYEGEIPSKDPMPLVMMFRYPRDSYLKMRHLPGLKPGEMKLPISVSTRLRIWKNNLNMNTKLRMGPEGQEEYVDGTVYADVKWNSLKSPTLLTWNFMPSPTCFLPQEGIL
eukprot:TRINITY_DN11334_c0_g1_i1.p1 TRINITY_DN11334_c0_g1~~TRINITY_DN11334_c0_g1_i1.p1  ORF type:complete len:495 (-),score=104.37 TRINITY_DN11334_c0_g1_i1:175-1659(-)